MKNIEIDDDIYRFLLKHTEEIGENASSILRRLLKIPEPGMPLPVNTGHHAETIIVPLQEEKPAPPLQVERDPVTEFLQSSHFQTCNNATDRYLAVLAMVFQEHRDEFDRIRKISGTQRIYFSKSETEIANAGNATQPHRIPGTPWFALTNNDTPNKLRLIDEVMRLFRYPIGDINRIKRAILNGFESASFGDQI